MNVAFLIYRRPELTERVFAEIRKARPERLLVVADGPKNEEERVKCMAARAVVEKIDWPCEVLRNYSDVNLGCRKRVSSGLDWVFNQVEEAIILEDDCLPDPSFFPFCCELLERYRDDKRIMHISGNNFQRGIKRTQHSYYFSKYPHCWGWATWRRAWQLYDAEMKNWDEFKQIGGFEQTCENPRELAFWSECMNNVYCRKVDSWNNVWGFSLWAQSGLAILPEVNLVSNIGFGMGGTNAKESGDPLANLETKKISGLKHPPFVVRNLGADDFTFVNWYQGYSPWWNSVGCRVFNRYWYGAVVRRIPILGSVWARWR